MFSSLVKQNKKAKICFVIHIAGEKKLLFYIYAVIVKQFFYKRSTNYYLQHQLMHRLRRQEEEESIHTSSQGQYVSLRSHDIGAGRESERERDSLGRRRGGGGRCERGWSKPQCEVTLPNLRGHAAAGRGADTHRGCCAAAASQVLWNVNSHGKCYHPRLRLLEEAREAEHKRGLTGGRWGGREDGASDGVASPRPALLPLLDVSKTVDGAGNAIVSGALLSTRVRPTPGRPTPSEGLKTCEMSLLQDLESLFNQLQEVEAEDDLSARETVLGKPRCTAGLRVICAIGGQRSCAGFRRIVEVRQQLVEVAELRHPPGPSSGQE